MAKSLPAALAVLILAFATGCRAGSGLRQAGLLPESNEVPGWGTAGNIRTFEAADLWQYIDGGAEKYIQAGLERTVTSNYRYKDGLEAVADVYVMRTGEGARSTMESETAVGARRAELGDACRLYTNSVVFTKGRYFVRVTAFSEAPNAEAALLLLGSGIERKLEQPK